MVRKINMGKEYSNKISIKKKKGQKEVKRNLKNWQSEIKM